MALPHVYVLHMKDCSAAETSATTYDRAVSPDGVGIDDEIPAIDLRSLLDGIDSLGRVDSVLADVELALGRVGQGGDQSR